jgi:hypothetical protein
VLGGGGVTTENVRTLKVASAVKLMSHIEVAE